MTTHPTSLTARTPEDLLAVVPVVLGFTPDDSVVMLTFGARQSFHARVDLPPPEHAEEVTATLLAPALQHDVERVVLLLYSDRVRPAEQVGRVLLRGFRAAGVDVIDLLRVEPERWFPLLRGRAGRGAGVPYDISAHPFLAQAVLDGRVAHACRDDLAASLTSDPARVAAVLAALPDVDLPGPAWVTATTRRLAAAGEVPDDAVAARLLAGIAHDPSCRDATWVGLERALSPSHVELWADLLRRAPDALAADAASVLALMAWLSGHGALAWCAVDRAEEHLRGHSLAALVADFLTSAVPPTAWEEVFARPEPA